jgi:hypothetical protein
MSHKLPTQIDRRLRERGRSQPELTRPRNDDSGLQTVYPGSEYDAEQLEFLRACDRETCRKRRPLYCTEILAIARALGYRKVATPEKPE